MIAIMVTRQIDHFDRFAKAQARMRAAETVAVLDRAIGAMDVVCAAILANPVTTAAGAALKDRAQQWETNRTRQIVTAHQTLANMEAYRKRRVGPSHPNMQKLAGAVS